MPELSHKVMLLANCQVSAPLELKGQFPLSLENQFANRIKVRESHQVITFTVMVHSWNQKISPRFPIRAGQSRRILVPLYVVWVRIRHIHPPWR